MARMERSDRMYALVGMACLMVIGWALFRFHGYRDFASAPFATDGVPLAVSVGTEGDEGVFFSRRGEPYLPRLSLASPPDDMPPTAFVQKLALRSVETGMSLPLDGRATRLGIVPLNDGSVVFLLDGLRLPYEDYRVSGELVFPGNGSERRFPFTCPLRVAPSSEWRFTLMDILMSV